MSQQLRAVGLGAFGIATVFAAWTALVWFGIVSQNSVPYPSTVVAEIPGMLIDPDFLISLGDTLRSWLIALVLSSLAAIVVGVLIGTLPWLTAPASVAVSVFRSIPSTALIPLAILLFGLGLEMKVSVAIYAVFWIVLINTMYGVASVEPMRRDVARSLQWGWLRTHIYVTIPSALPSIASGVRVSSGIAVVVVISAELLGAKSGIGTLMVQYQQALQIDAVYAILLLVGLVGTILYVALSRIEKASTKWVQID